MDFDHVEEIMRIMVGIIDQLEKLPKECPEINKSATFADMCAKRDELVKTFKRQTEELNNSVDLLDTDGFDN